MASLIENYGFIGDLHGAALVSRDGSVDWLCMPRFDSDACMAALLGRDEHGCWQMFPSVNVRRIERRYRPGTLILKTDYHCDGGAVRLVDFMPYGSHHGSVLRVVEGLEGAVPVNTMLRVRFGFGGYRPWILKEDDHFRLTTSPNSLALYTPAALESSRDDIWGLFTVRKGELVPFELTWNPAHEAMCAPRLDVLQTLEETERNWKEWSGRSKYQGRYKDIVDRSLITLKGMIYAPSGGIVAAPTAALPEAIGGARNWDYRYCWLRDATLTLDGLMVGGYVEEAQAWRQWLLNAIAGAPKQLQIMYGIDGERNLKEYEIPWLPGYEESRPVRIGNAASEQFQLDVYGEVIQARYEARRLGVPEARGVREPARELAEFLETAWQKPDDGIWEVRGGRRHFVHSKMMAWVAIDRLTPHHRGVHPTRRPRATDAAALPPPARPHSPRRLRARLRQEAERVHAGLQRPGPRRRRAAHARARLLAGERSARPGHDPGDREEPHARRVRAPLQAGAQQRRTCGLGGGVSRLQLLAGRRVRVFRPPQEAEALFERLIALRNDLDLLSEEYEPRSGRLISNFPQAFSHLALVHSASVLSNAELTPRATTNGGAKQHAAPAAP